MINYIWAIFIIISILYSVVFGKAEVLNASIFDSLKSAVEMTITFFGTICLWNGFMKIAQETSIMKKLQNFVNPFMKLLFPKLEKNNKAYNEITINIVANLLGLGNAATPYGLKAMNSLQSINNKKERLSDSMFMFIVLNAASMQIIPSTVIAIRTSLQSKSPCSIIVPIWIATIIANIIGIIVAKIFIKFK